MEVSLFLPLCDGLQIEQVTEGSNQLLISLGSRSPKACCPLCGGQAWRVHSHYTRHVADLPCAGRHMILLLTVRKFFCPHPACPRKIFAEQFASAGAVVCAHHQSLARRSCRPRFGYQRPGERAVGPKAGDDGFGSHEARDVCARSIVRLPHRCAFLASMIGPGRRARRTARCWSILSCGAQSRFFQTAKRRRSKRGCVPTQK